ncbi:MAG: hypothetical protein Q7S61_01975 [bacterium]|nr:hypothetical protein [bacterium]
MKSRDYYPLFLGLIVLLYIGYAVFNLLNFDVTRYFGSIDYQPHWQSIANLFSLLLKKGAFFLSMFNDLIFLPLLGVGLSYVLGKQILGKKGMLLFLSLLFIYGINNDFNSVTHLIPALGFILLCVGIYHKNNKKILFGAVFLVASFISNVGRTQSTYMDTCRDIFPRLGDITHIASDPYSQSITLNLFHFFQRMNYYMAIPILIIFFIICVYYRKSRGVIVFIPLLIYSLLSYIAELSTPCHISNSFTFPFLILAYVLTSGSFSHRFRQIGIGILIWLIISSGLPGIIRTVSESPLWKNENIKKTYLPRAGVYLPENIAKDYQDTTDYILSHSSPQDYVLSYRNGPYNLLADRPTTLTSALLAHPPKLIVINTYNAPDLLSSLSGVSSGFFTDGSHVFIEGFRTKIEDYIEDNYSVVKKNKLAWILAKRTKPDVKKLYVPIPKAVDWNTEREGLLRDSSLSSKESIVMRVTQAKSSVLLSAPVFTAGNQIHIPIKADLGNLKQLSKYTWNVFFINAAKKVLVTKRIFITGDWQEIWVDIPETKEGESIVAIAIQPSENLGFLPWGNLSMISLKLPQTFIPNPNLQLEQE